MEKACTLNDFEPKLNDVRKRKKGTNSFLVAPLEGLLQRPTSKTFRKGPVLSVSKGVM